MESMDEPKGKIVREGPPVVRERAAKTVLNRSKIGTYSLNCYLGCRHACVYCYARFMQRFHPHPEEWGEFVDVKVNAVEALYRQLRRMEPGPVFVSSACDAYQPLEEEYGLTRRCARLLMEYGFKVNVLTKSTLVLRDLEMYAEKRLCRIGVTVTTPDAEAAAVWEPRVPPPEERFDVLRRAKEEGLETGVMFGPLLPEVSDDFESIDRLFERAAQLDVDVIHTDCMNPRPRVWPSVRRLLAAEYPDLLGRYRDVLFDGEVREKYSDNVWKRVELAARRHGVSERLA